MSNSTRVVEDQKRARKSALDAWARESLAAFGPIPAGGLPIEPASDDASFRRYFRGQANGETYIFVDAPPEKENSEPFVRVAAILHDSGVNAPQVLRVDLEAGFMMLSDLGSKLYFDVLLSGPESEIERLYEDAFDALEKMQLHADTGSLAGYDEALLRTEMGLFTEWFLPRQLDMPQDHAADKLIVDVFDELVASALDQPSVFVHRDYHCRNLMVVPGNNPGVIDFQDAVAGPVTYDLVSLLKDCYHRFEASQVDDWVESYRQRLIKSGVVEDVAAEKFARWFDLMGMQRHLKCAGIFSRLNLRDGKARYLGDIPLVVDYILETARKYPEFSAFADWLQLEIVPRVADLDKKP